MLFALEWEVLFNVLAGVTPVRRGTWGVGQGQVPLLTGCVLDARCIIKILGEKSGKSKDGFFENALTFDVKFLNNLQNCF